MREEYLNLKEELFEFFSDVKNLRLKRQIPNILTFSRLLSPIVIIPLTLLKLENIILYAMTYFVLTDLLDGFIARRLNIVSNLGKTLDTISDKIFIVIALVPLISINYKFIYNIILELVIGLYTLYNKVKGIDIYSSLNGKVKTVILFSTTVVAYLSYIWVIDLDIINSLIIFSIIFQILTIISYVLQKFEIKGDKK